MAGKSQNSPHPLVMEWFASTLCSDCQAARLLSWDQESDIRYMASDRPHHAIDVEGYWGVVHCDYFRRRVELPDQLTFCAAHRAK